MLRLYATMQDGHRELTWNTFCCKVLTVIFIVAGPSAETRVHGVVDGRGAERNCERMRKPNRERRVLPFRLSPEHVMLPGKATPPPARSKRECHQRAAPSSCRACSACTRPRGPALPPHHHRQRRHHGYGERGGRRLHPSHRQPHPR